MVRFRDQFLHSIQGAFVIPGVRGQKILQRPRRHAQGIGHRLYALPFDAGELATHVPSQMLTTLAARKATRKKAQKTIQIRRQSTNASNIHVPNLQPIIAGAFIV